MNISINEHVRLVLLFFIEITLRIIISFCFKSAKLLKVQECPFSHN